MHDLWRLDK